MATIKHRWDEDDVDWNIQVGVEGEHFTLNAESQIEEGHSRLTFKDLKPLIIQHLNEPYSLEQLRKRLGELYALILAGHPNAPHIKLDIQLDGKQVTGKYAYLWTAYREGDYDLLPHRYLFLTKVPMPVGKDELQEHDLEMIFEMGIKQGTGGATEREEGDESPRADDWGIDVYGNGRLIQRNVRNQLQLTDEIGSDNTAKLLKGRLILNGPSHAIPWDTHKSRLADIHPALSRINPLIGSIVLGYVAAAREAAGPGGIESAVKEFKKKPWNQQWAFTLGDGSTVSLEHDYRHLPQPVPAAGADAGPIETTPGGEVEVGAPPASPAPEGSDVADPGSVQGGTESTAPAPPPETASPERSEQGTPPSAGDVAQPVVPPQPPVPSLPLPRAPRRSSRSSRRAKKISFSVTTEERQELLAWCGGGAVKDLGDKIKAKVFATKAADTARPATPPPAPPADALREQNSLRDLVANPAIMSKLLQHRLSSIAIVRAAGRDGLLRAGLTPTQADEVVGKVGNG